MTILIVVGILLFFVLPVLGLAGGLLLGRITMGPL
jgi:hypothetical protein